MGSWGMEALESDEGLDLINWVEEQLQDDSTFDAESIVQRLSQHEDLFGFQGDEEFLYDNYDNNVNWHHACCHVCKCKYNQHHTGVNKNECTYTKERHGVCQVFDEHNNDFKETLHKVVAPACRLPRFTFT